jgi:hypothetical protein
MAINAVTASYGSYAVAAVSPADGGQQAPPPAIAIAKTDTVQLSSAALALSLEAAGDSPEEIASVMGLDINTVDDYLGIVPYAAPPPPQISTFSVTV